MNKVKYDYEINAYIICLKNISRFFQKHINIYILVIGSFIVILLNIVVYSDIL